MNALTVHIFFGEIVLRCRDHGTVAVWPSGVELADGARVTQRMIPMNRVATLGGVS